MLNKIYTYLFFIGICLLVINIFNNYKIINVSQKILRINAKNLSVHTWYLKNKLLFLHARKSLQIYINKLDITLFN